MRAAPRNRTPSSARKFTADSQSQPGAPGLVRCRARDLEIQSFVLSESSNGFADPRGMKLCPIHRTCRRSDFLSDGWESVDSMTASDFTEFATLFLSRHTRSLPSGEHDNSPA